MKSRQNSAASQRSTVPSARVPSESRVPSATRSMSGSASREMSARRKSSKPIIRNNVDRRIPTKKRAMFTKIDAKPKPPVMPPVLKQWLDFKPNMDPKNPIAEPSEHEKDLINKRRLIRTAEMQREIDRRLSQPKHASSRPARPK